MNVDRAKQCRVQRMTATLSRLICVSTSLLLCAFALDGLEGESAHKGEIKERTTFTVNAQGNDPDADLTDNLCGTARSGCTLRAAIEQANATAGADVIEFDLGPAIPFPTLNTGSLPDVTETVTIDGATGGAVQVELTGIGGGGPVGNAGTGLVFTGDNNVIRNLIIIGYNSPGITLRTGKGSLLENTWIGLSSTGIIVPNMKGGLLIDNSADNMIGGVEENQRNVISGNKENGITIQGTQAKNNTVVNTFIGTNADGDAIPGKRNSPTLANEEAGILIDDAPENTIGGGLGSGNLISGNTTNGIEIRGENATKNTILGNSIGIDNDGTADLGNGANGVLISNAPENTLGGTGFGEGNFIAGNGENGVAIEGENATRNLLVGNRIGIDGNGEALGNDGNGVCIDEAPGNTIGGTEVLPFVSYTGNLISGNKKNGVEIGGEDAANNVVLGNYIGTNGAGTMALPNEDNGVFIFDASNNTVGGVAAGAPNLISGNKKSGIVIRRFTEAKGNLVVNNFIGTTADGEAPLSNSEHGVVIDAATESLIELNVISGNTSSGVYIIVGTENIVRNNDIGTDKDGEASLSNGEHGVALVDPDPNAPGSTGSSNNTIRANLIAYNGLDGVFISGSKSIDNAIRANDIVSNGGLGINLTNDGVTENDEGDGDTGPNTLQNFPVLTSAGGADLTLGGSLNSKANATFSIEFFVNQACDPSGHGEGEFFLGTDNVTTDSDGNASLLTTFAGASVPIGFFITATATDSTGNTSEFSACVGVDREAGCSLEVTTSNGAGAGSLREAIACANLTPNGALPDSITFAIAGTGVPLIAPGSALPTIVDPVVIDATTQPDAGMVRVDGNQAGPEANGLHITAGGSTVKGLALTRFSQHGLLLETAGNNAITQTYIGTDADGTPDLGNQGNGVHISGGSGANEIGGTDETTGNVIYGNAGAGVAVTGETLGNAIRGNRISANAGLGIDLANDGVTDNDPDDGDTGPNTLQNFPALTMASSGSLRLEGTLNSTPETAFDLEFFANPACEPLANGQGDMHLGVETITTDANGDAAFAVTFSDVDLTEGFVTATATDPEGNTSEFSACLEITSTSVAVENEADLPAIFQVHGNYPNPFNPETQIAFDLPRAAPVTLAIYNVLGQHVAVLVSEVRPAGRHEVTWNGDGLPSGIYFYRLTAGDFHAVRKMTLTR